MVEPGLLDLVYEAAAVPELWPDVLAGIAERAGAWGAGLLSFDPTGHMRFTATKTYERTFSAFAANSDKYDNRRPKRVLASGHVGFLHDLELFTQEELDDDPLYQDFIYRDGLKWTAGTVIPAPSHDLLVFDMCRREQDGTFDRHTMLTLDQFRPHLARAALLSHRLGMRAARGATEALQTLGMPAAVLDRSGRAISMNEGLESLAPQVTTAAFDYLQFTNPFADKLFQEAVRDISTSVPTGTMVRSIPIPATEDRFALVVHVVPVRRAASDIFVRAASLVIVTPVTAPSSPLAEVLTGLFDLTAAEARVARGISSGQSLTEIAQSQKLSHETVRSQCKSVLMKTGTRRQSELVLLLSGAVGPVSG